MKDFFRHILHEFRLPLSNPILVFSLILFIILLAPILLKKIKIPGIIGLIISGVIIGPYGLNLLAKNSAVELFSIIGLLYIMFIAGLELDLAEFKANKNKSFLFGFFTFIMPLLIGFPVCYYLLGYNFNASFLTASMFATHTLVAYPIVGKLGIVKNQAVAITVGGTILTDTAVLIILAVIMGNNQGNLDQTFWLRLGGSLVIFSLIMLLIIPRIAKWFFQKLESEKHAHYIFVLSVVFFAAFLSQMSGVEPIIGAFVAGLVLNPLIPHSSALMNRIEFIGNSLFIPFFLISVGMLVNVRVISSGPMAIIVALTLTVVALCGKWLAALFTQLVFRYSVAQRQLIFGLSSAHAAATLAIILVGYKANILDENIFNGTIILILITCVVASFATEKAGKKIAMNEENGAADDLAGIQLMNEQILIPVDNLPALEYLVDFASLIKDKKSVNPVTLLSVVPNNDEAEYNVVRYKKALKQYVDQGSAAEVPINIIATIDHNLASGIVRISKEIMADLVLIEWPSKVSFFDKLFGEKADSVINNINKNIYVCRFVNSLIDKNRLFFICPPFSEKEFGFIQSVQKISRLSQELSMPVLLFSEERTRHSVIQILQKLKLSPNLICQTFTDWEDSLILSRDIQNNDLIVFNAARKGALSYLPLFDKILQKFEKYFVQNNMIIVYPQQQPSNIHLDPYDDFTSEPLTKSIETIEQIGKSLSTLFKRT